MEDRGMKEKKWAAEVKEEEDVVGRGGGGRREVTVLMLLSSLLSLFSHTITPSSQFWKLFHIITSM